MLLLRGVFAVAVLGTCIRQLVGMKGCLLMSHLVIFSMPQLGGSIVMSMFGCLPLCEHISRTTHPNFTRFPVHFAYNYFLMLVWCLQCAMYFQFRGQHHVFP